jgi:hypothetical protein
LAPGRGIIRDDLPKLVGHTRDSQERLVSAPGSRNRCASQAEIASSILVIRSKNEGPGQGRNAQPCGWVTLTPSLILRAVSGPEAQRGENPADPP